MALLISGRRLRPFREDTSVEIRHCYSRMAIASLLVATSIQAEPLALKDIQLGISEKVLLEQYKGLGCSDAPPEYGGIGRLCRFKGKIPKPLDTLAGQPVEAWEFFLYKDVGLHMARARLSEKTFAPVLAALKEKFGPPKHLSKEKKVDKGVVVSTWWAFWTDGSSRKSVSINSPDNEPTLLVTFVDPELREKSAEARGSSKKGASDL